MHFSNFKMDASMQERYDTAFLGILQNEGNIQNFLDRVFSFLYRRTDFYQHINEQKTMGFPPGVAAKLAYKAFKTYEDKADQNRKIMKEKMEARKRKLEASTPPVAKVEEVTTDAEEKPTQDKATTQDAAKQTAPEAVASAPEAAAASAKEAAAPAPVAAASAPVAAPSTENNTADNTSAGQADKASEGKEENSAAAPDAADTKDPDDDPELTGQQRIFQANPDSYNGAIRDKYSWGQEITEVDVRVKIPQHVKKGKQCQVDIGRKHLKVSVASVSGEWETLIDGDMTWDVNREQSMWTLVNDEPRPGQPKQTTIHINLEKVQERWWDALLTDEPKISVRKIDPSRPMTDLDDEAQAKLEQMMWDERQKALGLPQSGQIKMQGMLKDAWDAPGSPFKGQPFDLSKVNISGDGSSMNMNPGDAS